MVFDCSTGTRRRKITEQEWCVDATAKCVKGKIDDVGPADKRGPLGYKTGLLLAEVG
jgi:hypothetical protein